MKAIGIIPARWKASRFEGKMLAEISGKPLIQYVWERAKESHVLEDLIIATDSEKVIKAAEMFGGKAVYTSKDQPSGTDRIAEVVNAVDVEVIVNIQGDEPLIHYSMIDNLAQTLLEDKSIPMATIIRKVTDKAELENPNVVKVAVDKDGYALYFSRYPIPYVRETASGLTQSEGSGLSQSGGGSAVFYKHIGIYAYTKDFLFTYTNLPKSPLEQAEKLEQLRALENGYKIKTIETDYDTIGVDTPEDLKKAEEALKNVKTG
ncbi:MAG: 3-deoxy-manno-octulosonate cytidylyltransferase [Candidatus Omnitrophica bacterium]|nr:3-deoxy-manno-octulosonate cytidylyltransferase [Candidatus Omnitrophota bacterium]